MISTGTFCNVCDMLTHRGLVSVKAAVTLKYDTSTSFSGKKKKGAWCLTETTSVISWVRARSLVTETGAYCHISSLINRIMSVLFTVEGSSIYRRVLCDDSRCAHGRVEGQTAAVWCEAADSRQTVICHSPRMEGSPPRSCLTLSEMTAGFQQAGVICHKTNCYKSARQI